MAGSTDRQGDASREAADDRKAGVRLAMAAAVGLVVAAAVAAVHQLRLAPVAGWLGTATVYTIGVWTTIRGYDDEQTAAHATREDPSRSTADFLLVLAAVISLGTMALVLARAGHAKGGSQVAYVAVALSSVVASWFVVHTLYTLHYARLYYGDKVGGVNFNQQEPPRYADFAYLSFTIGMTFQVSDTNLEARELRAAALRHALLSYLFGAGILATAINLVAGLSK